VNPILAGIALVVVAGGVVAVSARDARAAILGLAVVLIGSPVVADPVPAPLGLATRFVGAVLSAYLLWVVARDRPRAGVPSASTGGSKIGWPAEILLAVAAGVVGFAAHGLGAPALGSPLASAAGFAVAALALTPTMTGRDVLRVGLGSLLLIDAALLVRGALGGTPGELEQLITSAMLVVLAGTLATLAASARADGTGGFAFSLDERTRRRRPADAHPLDDR
jgi:hypothetical protein